MRVTFNVPDNGLSYLEWLDVGGDGECLAASRPDLTELFADGYVRNIAKGKPVEFRLKIFAPDQWEVIGKGEPGFPDGFTVKSIK